MRVLVVEDEHKIANAIKVGLTQEGYAVDVAYDGLSGYDLAVGEEYDLIVLDILLPGLDGIAFSKKLRADHNHTPVLLLTALGQLADKVTGLDSGADDYLTKPFAFEELLARIRAISRRPKHALGTQLTVGDLKLDTLAKSITRSGKSISLSVTEYSILHYLLRNPDRVVSKTQLISHVCNYDSDVLPNTVEVNIRNLRQKIGAELIHTVRGFGYKINTS